MDFILGERAGWSATKRRRGGDGRATMGWIAWLCMGLACPGVGSDEVGGFIPSTPAERSPGTVVEEPPAHRSLRVLFDGCVRRGPAPRCVLTAASRSLTIWVDIHEPSLVRLSIDGVTVEAKPRPVEHGWRWVLEVPRGARRLELVDQRRPQRLGFGLALETQAWSEPILLRAMEQAADRAPALTRQYLVGQLERWQGDALVFALLVAGKLARMDADVEDYRALYARGVEVAQAQHQWGYASQMAQTLAFECIERRDFECGRSWLDRDAELAPFPTPSHQYFRGLLAERRGDLGNAQLIYQRSLHDIRALGDPLDSRAEQRRAIELAVRSRLVLLLAGYGSRAQVEPELSKGLILAESVQARHRARFLNIAGWAGLISNARAPSSSEPMSDGLTPRRHLERAWSMVEGSPTDIDLEHSIRLNLAYAALERDDANAARRWLAGLGSARLPRVDALWYRLLRARLAGLERDFERARRILKTMIVDAERDEDHSFRWIARVDYAGVLERLGRDTEALAEYAAADRVLEQQLPYLGLGARDRLMAERDVGVRRHLSLLISRGDDTKALCVARLARTRSLRDLDRRIRRDAAPSQRRVFDRYLGRRVRLDEQYDQTFWIAHEGQAAQRRREIQQARAENHRQFEAAMRSLDGHPPPALGCDSLSTPRPGEIDLHYVRLASGWVGFTMDSTGYVDHAALGSLDIPLLVDQQDARQWLRLSQALLSPFASQIEAAHRVRVMPVSELYRVPFQALPWAGAADVLSDRVPVVYGVDLPRSKVRANQRGVALVIAPPSNLPYAGQEVQHSVTQLRQRGATVLQIDDRTQSKADPPRLLSDRVLSAIPHASWLHYVGHAQSNEPGGWGSELVLTGDRSMTVGVADILALPAVPHTVVLNGCETGVVDSLSLGGGMSLAQAFLLAGARVVVATTHEVRDEDAMILMRQMYESLDDLSDTAVPRALQRAQGFASVRASSPFASAKSSPWWRVRAWVP